MTTTPCELRLLGPFERGNAVVYYPHCVSVARGNLQPSDTAVHIDLALCRSVVNRTASVPVLFQTDWTTALRCTLPAQRSGSGGRQRHTIALKVSGSVHVSLTKVFKQLRARTQGSGTVRWVDPFETETVVTNTNENKKNKTKQSGAMGKETEDNGNGDGGGDGGDLLRVTVSDDTLFWDAQQCACSADTFWERVSAAPPLRVRAIVRVAEAYCAPLSRRAGCEINALHLQFCEMPCTTCPFSAVAEAAVSVETSNCETGLRAVDHPVYGKYLRMRQKRLPDAAVRQKMLLDAVSDHAEVSVFSLHFDAAQPTCWENVESSEMAKAVDTNNTCSAGSEDRGLAGLFSNVSLKRADTSALTRHASISGVVRAAAPRIGFSVTPDVILNTLARLNKTAARWF